MVRLYVLDFETGIEIMNLDQFKFTKEQKDFVACEIDRLKNIGQKSQTEQVIFDLFKVIESGTSTKLHFNSFERILKNEFKKHKARIGLEKIKDDEKRLLANLKKDAQAKSAQLRKKREHTLISIGALFDMVEFPTQDRGIITGVILEAMERSKSQPQYFEQCKIKGYQFIAQRENEKKAKSIVIDKASFE